MIDNSTNSTVIENWHYDRKAVVYVVCFFSISGTIINFLTIFVILSRKKLRRPANYSIVSFLFGALIQAIIVAPLFITGTITHSHPNKVPWLCDIYRFPYFLCGHIMQVSLLLVSFDRLFAIKYPYRYRQISTKRIIIGVIVCAWCTIIFTDLMPLTFFDREPDNDGCNYTLEETWGISVLLFFNILPFLITSFNYFTLWKLAASMALKDFRQQESLHSESGSFKDKSDRDGQIDITNQDKDRKMFSKFKTFRLAMEIKATKTSGFLLIVYLICWGPLGIFYIIDQFCSHCMTRCHVTLAGVAVNVICFSSSSLIPLVYCWRTKEFQKELVRYCCQLREVRIPIWSQRSERMN